jgi:YbbR domain-containing protein
MISYVRNLLFGDFWLKLFSLALAILIWLTVSFAKEGSIKGFGSRLSEQNYYNIPVLVMSSAADVQTVRVDPNVVQVTVQGERKLLENLQPKDIRALVDLTGIESARGLHKRIEVTTPPGITYVRVIPSEVEVIIPPKR